MFFTFQTAAVPTGLGVSPAVHHPRPGQRLQQPPHPRLHLPELEAGAGPAPPPHHPPQAPPPAALPGLQDHQDQGREAVSQFMLLLAIRTCIQIIKENLLQPEKIEYLITVKSCNIISFSEISQFQTRLHPLQPHLIYYQYFLPSQQFHDCFLPLHH